MGVDVEKINDAEAAAKQSIQRVTPDELSVVGAHDAPILQSEISRVHPPWTNARVLRACSRRLCAILSIQERSCKDAETG